MRMPACITILTLSAAVAHAGVPLGACCNLAAQTCVDDVPDTACTAPGESWFEGLACCEIDCVDAAAGFDASGVALWSRIPVEDFPDDPITGPQTRANEMWGYVSPSGREYAILGLERGAAFVDVTDPQCPVIVAYIEGQGINTIWRDMATFGPYAYIVTDGGGVGLQIVDMTNIDAGVVTLVNTTDLGAGFVDAHNVFVNADTGFLYLCIPNLSAGQGLTVVDLTDPVNPTVAGSWIDTAPGVRCHDVQVVTYTQGPNAGREIAFCFAEDDGLKIADVTDKANMFTVATLVYPNTTYTHQGWLTEDRSFLFIGDELDELQDPDVTETTTYVIDVQTLENPTLATTFTNGLGTIDHNMMVRGNFLYEANYSSGLRVFDITDVMAITEVGFFDTRPEDNGLNFNGAWGVFTAFPSGIVTLSDRDRGLFVFDVSAITRPVAIPTVSEWGMIVLAACVFTIGAVLASRRRESPPHGTNPYPR